MTYTHMTRFVATVAGLLGSAAFLAVASLPGMAQSTVNSQESTSETRTYPGPSETPSGSPSVPGVSEVDDPSLSNSDPGSRRSVERDAMTSPDSSNSNSDRTNPSAVPGQGLPGPSETPSGSPSVPGVSVYDDPNDEPNTELMTPGQDSVEDSRQDGPSAVPGEGGPGPSETPSGSPSVPGVSGADDPGLNN